jgi:hypothetical protein
MPTPPAAFLDRSSEADGDALRTVLGPANERWERISAWALRSYGIEGETIWFGKEAGWCRRFRRGGRALFTLMPRIGAVAALVVVGPSAWERAAAAELSARTREVWDAARPYPDGRWLVLDLDTDEAVADLECLVALKSPPPRHVRKRSSQPTLV